MKWILVFILVCLLAFLLFYGKTYVGGYQKRYIGGNAASLKDLLKEWLVALLDKKTLDFHALNTAAALIPPPPPLPGAPPVIPPLPGGLIPGDPLIQDLKNISIVNWPMANGIYQNPIYKIPIDMHTRADIDNVAAIEAAIKYEALLDAAERIPATTGPLDNIRSDIRDKIIRIQGVIDANIATAIMTTMDEERPQDNETQLMKLLRSRGNLTRTRDAALSIAAKKAGSFKQGAEQEKIDFLNTIMDNENFPKRDNQNTWKGFIKRYDMWIRQRSIPPSKRLTEDDLQKITHLI